jgi:MerR family transcriptional regulator, redox-sensitive transcriptional activator SoxR
MTSWHDALAEPMTIRELARRTGVATSALRYYEQRGLIAAQRTPAGHRRYQRAVLRRVAFIVFAQRIGLTLEEIATELASLPADRIPGGDDWARLSERWDARIEARIAELMRLRSGLSDCIGCGCLSLERCAVLNPGDRAASAGSGPLFWRVGRDTPFSDGSVRGPHSPAKRMRAHPSD